jgi:hypothetical protein
MLVALAIAVLDGADWAVLAILVLLAIALAGAVRHSRARRRSALSRARVSGPAIRPGPVSMAMAASWTRERRPLGSKGRPSFDASDMSQYTI